MNKDWKDEYEGHLELWEIDDEHNNQSHDSPEHGDQDATAKGESS